LLEKVFNKSFLRATAMAPKKDPSKSSDSSSTGSESDLKSPTAEQNAAETTMSPAAKGPANWETVYANIQEMRKDKSAAVDTMGCERAHDLQADPKARKDL
jgi:hypothetical protein